MSHNSISPIHLLHRAAQSVTDVFSTELGDKGITPRQLAVLTAVADDEGSSQTGLTAVTGIDRSTIADIVKRLQRKGLLRRRRTKADARAYAVKLTDGGRQLLRTVEPLAKRVDDRVFSALPAGQRERFLDALPSIVDRLERKSATPAR